MKIYKITEAVDANEKIVKELKDYVKD